ncbi:MAG: RagB/SusD family nutrient uptake outer membrane protein [Bacteroidota bacterium]
MKIIHKKLMRAGFCLSALLLLQACNFLDLKPFDKKPADLALNSISGANSMLTQAYAALNNYYGDNLYRVSELYTDNINEETVELSYGDFAGESFGTFNGLNGGIWSNGYNAVFYSNVIIHIIEDNIAQDGTEEDKTALRGQAYFVRALGHFDVLNIYALPYTVNNGATPGIPIRTKYVTTENAFEKIGRNTVAEVYTQIISDLNKAIELLPEIQPAPYADKRAAKALLARVYFNMENYQEAFNASDAVISASGAQPRQDSIWRPFQVTLGFASPRTIQSNAGLIFQLVEAPTQDNSGGIRGMFFAPTTPTLNNRYLAMDTVGIDNNYTSSIVADFRAVGGDYLTQLSYAPVNKAFTTPVYALNKFYNINPVNIPVIRMNEMYLTRAESRAMIGGDEAAVRSDVNYVRHIAHLDDDNSISGKDNLLAWIHKLRRVEMAGEGDHFRELRRLKSTAMRKLISGNKVRYDDRSKLLKIPTSETNANPAIEQNN